MRVLALVAILLLAPLAAGSHPLVLVPRNGDADVPAATAPDAVVTVFDRDTWSFTEGVRTRDLVVPAGEWDRIVLVFTGEAGTDPWDRLFAVGIDGTEVFHGTTPRIDMTLRRDVTAYAALLPGGATVPIQLAYGTWVGYARLSVAFEFYADEPTAALVEAPHDVVVSPLFFRGTGAPGSTVAATATFPAAAATSGLVELTTSGHGAAGEFFYLEPSTPPTFRILVDGEEIGSATALPYVYALLGFSGGSVVTNALHQGMWWTAQQGLDVAGVHTGDGEIPAYRAALPADVLAQLTGEREVAVLVDGGAGGYWPVSVTFLLDE